MYEARITKLRAVLREKNLDAILLSNFYNISFFTGFQSLTENEREAFVLVAPKNVYLFTDARYTYEGELATLRYLEPSRGLLTQLTELCLTEKIGRVGFESEDLTHNEYHLLTTGLPAVQFFPTSQLGVRVREVKEEGEISYIKTACEVTDMVLKDIVSVITVGMREKEIAYKMDSMIKARGYEPSFDPIVAVDANAAIPHYNTKKGNGVVADTSVVLIDFGVEYRGYSSDITRMVYMKNAPVEALTAYEILAKTQQETIDKAYSVTKLQDLDLYCRKLLTEKGYPDFPHSLGHGLGLEVHEYPKVSFNSTDLKKDGQIWTVEPGIYVAGKWGARVEDTVTVKNGQAIPLTLFSKDLLVCPVT